MKWLLTLLLLSCQPEPICTCITMDPHAYRMQNGIGVTYGNWLVRCVQFTCKTPE